MRGIEKLSSTVVLVGVFVAVAVCSQSGLYGAERGVGSLPERYIVNAARLDEARARLSLANLLGGLFLTEAQTKGLAGLAEQADRLRRVKLAGAQKTVVAAEKSFERLLGEVLHAPAASTAVSPSHRAAQDEAVDLDHRLKELRSEYNSELRKLQEQAVALLTAPQIKVIATFSPCVVPPRPLTDPVRVGQAAGTETVEQIVDVLRRAPKDLYERHVGELIEAAVRRVEHKKGALQAGARKAWVNEMRARIDRLRAMDDTEFALDGAAEARGLLLYDETKTVGGMEYWQPNKVGRYLLCRGAAEVLKGYRGGAGGAGAGGAGAGGGAGQQLSRFDPKMKQAFKSWGGAGKAMVQELQKAGQLPRWVEAKRRQIEHLVARKDDGAALEALRQACRRLAARAPAAARVHYERALLEDLVREKRLEVLFSIKGVDLFGLPGRAKRAQELLAKGRHEEVLALLAEIKGIVARFRE